MIYITFSFTSISAVSYGNSITWIFKTMILICTGLNIFIKKTGRSQFDKAIDFLPEVLTHLFFCTA